MVVKPLHLNARYRRSVAYETSEHYLRVHYGAVGKAQFDFREIASVGFFGFSDPGDFRRVSVGDKIARFIASPPVIVVF